MNTLITKTLSNSKSIPNLNNAFKNVPLQRKTYEKGDRQHQLWRPTYYFPNTFRRTGFIFYDLRNYFNTVTKYGKNLLWHWRLGSSTSIPKGPFNNYVTDFGDFWTFFRGFSHTYNKGGQEFLTPRPPLKPWHNCWTIPNINYAFKNVPFQRRLTKRGDPETSSAIPFYPILF